MLEKKALSIDEKGKKTKKTKNTDKKKERHTPFLFSFVSTLYYKKNFLHPRFRCCLRRRVTMLLSTAASSSSSTPFVFFVFFFFCVPVLFFARNAHALDYDCLCECCLPGQCELGTRSKKFNVGDPQFCTTNMCASNVASCPDGEIGRAHV